VLVHGSGKARIVIELRVLVHSASFFRLPLATSSAALISACRIASHTLAESKLPQVIQSRSGTGERLSFRGGSGAGRSSTSHERRYSA
jgi:hypothetical protein